MKRISMQKYCLLLSTLAVSTLGIASDKDDFTGFYGGVMAGALQTMGDLTSSTNANYITFFGNQSLTTSEESDIESFSAIGEIYLGYGDFLGESNFFFQEKYMAAYQIHKPIPNMMPSIKILLTILMLKILKQEMM